MPKATIDKREYWLEDTGYRIIIEGNYAYLTTPYYIRLNENPAALSLEALKKIWELLELVANDEWKPRPAKGK